MSRAIRMALALSLAAVCLAVAGPARAEEKVCRLDHAVVAYDGIPDDYAQAIARTVEAARQAAVELFAFDMPETITVAVTCDAKARVRLFNDGQDRFSLTVRSAKDLRKPAASGIFHLYGLCHEVGHLAMYRPIRDHSWMTVAAAEGWAHYVGSRLVDEVHARQGPDLWPDRYGYLADGMQRLARQLATGNPGDVGRGADLWKELAAIVGDKGLAPILQTWAKAEIDPADPGAAVRKALLAANDDKRLADWWNKAEPQFIFKRPRSDFAARTLSPRDLAGQPEELAHDDGTAAGKKSIAGGGHAVRFEVTGDTFYLTAVRIHGSRYGTPQAPNEDFHVWLCDAEMKAIADYPLPYSLFDRGEARWVTLRIPPTNVPSKFIVCVGFNPTATKGVFVSRDAASGGNSLSGLPGGGAGQFGEGDWLIRAVVDQARGADPLR